MITITQLLWISWYACGVVVIIGCLGLLDRISERMAIELIGYITGGVVLLALMTEK